MNRARKRAASAVAAVAGCIAAVIAAQPASATSSDQCAWSGSLVHQSTGGTMMWAGRETRGEVVPFTGTRLNRGQHFYQLRGKQVTLRFGDNLFALGNDAIFSLGCSALSATARSVMPSVSLMRGTVRVTTTRAREGTVFTEEGLVGQVPSSAGTTFTVRRALTQHGEPSLSQKIRWFIFSADQPPGSTSSATRTRARINVTPYVGPHRGTCRHVRSAVLTTIGTYSHGTAVYHF